MWHKFPHNDLVATHKFKIKSKIILNWSLSNISNFTYYRFMYLELVLGYIWSIMKYILKGCWSEVQLSNLTTICVNVRDRVWRLAFVCLTAISSQTAWGMETWMVPCCHKLSGACFKPLRFTKSRQKSSKKAKTSPAPCSEPRHCGIFDWLARSFQGAEEKFLKCSKPVPKFSWQHSGRSKWALEPLVVYKIF